MYPSSAVVGHQHLRQSDNVIRVRGVVLLSVVSGSFRGRLNLPPLRHQRPSGEKYFIDLRTAQEQPQTCYQQRLEPIASEQK